MTEIQPGPSKLHIVLLAIIFAVGIFLRVTPHAFSVGATLQSIAFLHPEPAFNKIGFDEGLYREYVNALSKDGLSSYPDIVQGYIDVQKGLRGSILPPLRFLFIFTAYTWHSIFGSEALDALRQVAAFFSMLTLALATSFAWRIRGPTWAIAIAALMAVAPTQLHMSQHALVDGFFTFWALLVLWLLWENLQAPRDWRWLVGYIVALGLLVLTKENSFFVWIALVALLTTNRWLQFGTVTRELVIATFLGPLLGVVALIFLAGGIDVFVQSYQLSVGKNFQLRYAILTGDGPWYRYLVDLLLVSPIILILSLGTVFRLNRTMKPELFMSIFIAASYLLMCNVKYGMNLRYANMWDMPLRFLAFSQILAMASLAKKYRAAVVASAVVLLAAIEFRQYIVLAVHYPLHELITHDLLQALQILKSL
ncbi:MAG TPA: glycosyltransferase family 39 protein [Chthoniobacterales bacterium]|nr:glycosyltransferase family 39 protein [Chthoniobacterales bacterium]